MQREIKTLKKQKRRKRKAKAAHATTKSFHEKPDLNYCLFESWTLPRKKKQINKYGISPFLCILALEVKWACSNAFYLYQGTSNTIHFELKSAQVSGFTVSFNDPVQVDVKLCLHS